MEDPVEYTTQVAQNATNAAQVTGYDLDAETLATMRALLPARLTTALAYMEAVKLHDDLMRKIEGFEKSEAFKRLTGAQ